MARATNSYDKVQVLLVEDSRVDAAIVKAMLTEKGDIDVTCVTTLRDAIYELAGKNYSVVVLDLGLPDSHDGKAPDALRQRFGDIPLIVLSGNEEEIASLRARHPGIDAFFTKDQADSGNIRDIVLSIIESTGQQ